MKRIMVLVLILALGQSSRAMGQFSESRDGPRLVAGPMAGVGFGTAHNDDGDAGARTSVIVGGFLTYLFNERMGIEPQVFYIEKGAAVTLLGGGGDLGFITGSTKVSYIEVPILFKIRYTISRNKQPPAISIIAGPALALRIKCSFVNSEGTAVSCGDQPPSTSPDLDASALDFSGVFGVGVDYRRFALQARYDLSFTDNYAKSGSSPSQRNAVWELTLGYRFGLH